MTDTSATPRPRVILKPLLFIAAILLVPVLIFLVFKYAKPSYEKSACETNLQQIAAAISQYADNHHGEYPDGFKTILLNDSISPSAFISPATTATPALGESRQEIAGNLSREHVDYVYLAGQYTKTTVKPDSVLAYEPLRDHHDGLHVLYGDGHVGWITAENAEAFLQSVQPRRK